MNIFKKFWNWLKNIITKKYKKEQFFKSDIIDYLDKKLPNKKVLSFKDIIDTIKKLCD